MSSILDVGPALLFDLPTAPGWEDAAADRRRRARAYRARMREARERRAVDRALLVLRQPRLPWIELPRTIGDCRGPGTCPVLRCRYNLALWVSENGSIKVGRAHQEGRTLRIGRRASEARLEAMADMVVEIADRLESLCVLDYAEAQRRDADADTTYRRIAEVLGCSHQRARAIVLEAAEEFRHAQDIEEARERRAQAAARRPPLVTIRARQAPVMSPSDAEIARVGN